MKKEKVRLEPAPDAYQPCPFASAIAGIAAITGGLADAMLMLEADIRCEIRRKFVAQTEGHFGGVEAAACLKIWHVLGAEKLNSTPGCKIRLRVMEASYSPLRRAVTSPLLDRKVSTSMSNQ